MIAQFELATIYKNIIRERSIVLLFRICAMAATLMLAAICSAQEYQVQNWHVENGLPDGTITAIAQTPDGYLWVGTRKGLVRFDGDRFKRVSLPGDATNSSITSLLTDRQGGLWVASESGLITRFADGEFQNRYSPKGWEFGETNATATNTAKRLSGWRALKSIFGQDAAGSVWALTSIGDIVKFDGAHCETNTEMMRSPSGRLRGLAADGLGRVWLLKGTNACVFDGAKWRESASDGFAVFNDLQCSSSNGIWVAENGMGSASAKMVTYDPVKGWGSSSLFIPSSSVHLLNALFEDSHGQVWMGLRWGGVYRGTAGGQWAQISASGLLGKCTCSCMFEDRRGSLWVGTLGEGIDHVQVHSVVMAPLPPEAADVHATTVCAARDGSLWIGTDKGLFQRPPGEESKFTDIEALRGESVYTVREDSRTNLWIGTQKALFRKEGDEFKRKFALPSNAGGLNALFEDRNHTIWAGGYHGIVFNVREEAQGLVMEQFSSGAATRFCCLTQDREGRIIGATRNAGLQRLEHGKWERLIPEFNRAGVDLRAVLCDEDDSIWIGTYGDGLYRWSPAGLQHFTTEDGMLDDVILGIAEDERGNLWMTSHNGILGCARRQLVNYMPGESPPLLCQRLGLDEGLSNRECSGAGQPVISRDAHGTFWVANMLGAAGFNPDSISRALPSVDVVMEALRADGDLVHPENREYRIPASARRLEFQYSAPELAAPQSLRFRYRLDGLDRNWVKAGSGRVASYSQLPVGTFEFRVMVGGADGVWRESPKSVKVEVVPPFWQKTWFRALAGLSSVILLGGGAALNERRKTRRRLERLEAQQAMERERRRIAQDLHDDLGARMTKIIMLAGLPEGEVPPADDSAGRLREVYCASQEMVKVMDETVWTVNPRNDTLQHLGHYAIHYAEEFLQNSGVRLHVVMAEEMPSVPIAADARHNMFMAMKEALNNSVKYAAATEIRLEMELINDTFRMTIADNGAGFDCEEKARSGDGLRNMKERLTVFGGRCNIQSTPGRGTAIVLELVIQETRK